MSARAICYYERTSTSPVAGIEHVNVSSVPIVLLALSRQKLAQMQLFDFGQNFIRPQLATVAGEPEEAMRVTGRRRRGARTLRCAPAIDYRS